jgi:hypothetical protein
MIEGCGHLFRSGFYTRKKKSKFPLAARAIHDPFAKDG